MNYRDRLSLQNAYRGIYKKRTLLAENFNSEDINSENINPNNINQIFYDDERLTPPHSAEVQQAIEKGKTLKVVDKNGEPLPKYFFTDKNPDTRIEGLEYDYEYKEETATLLFYEKDTHLIKYTKWNPFATRVHPIIKTYIESFNGYADIYNEDGYPTQLNYKNGDYVSIEYMQPGNIIKEKIRFAANDNSTIYEITRNLFSNKNQNITYKNYKTKENLAIVYTPSVNQISIADLNKNITTTKKYFLDTNTLHSKSLYSIEKDKEISYEEYDKAGKLRFEKDFTTGEIKRYDQDGKYIEQEPGYEDLYNFAPNSPEIKAAKKARIYNRQYHGLFLHTLRPYDVDKILSLDKEEVCVSTVRSSTVFRNPKENIVLIGFGHIRQLYDYDAYSEINDSGLRYQTAYDTFEDENDPVNLHNIEKGKDFDESKYYDEGFMPWGSADVLLASIPTTVPSSYYADDIGDTPSSKIDPRKRKDVFLKLRKAYPGIKIIKPEDFEKIKSSEQLLRILYKLKDERDSKQLMKGTFHKYEEKYKYK